MFQRNNKKITQGDRSACAVLSREALKESLLQSEVRGATPGKK
jgi:hypothetical protein